MHTDQTTSTPAPLLMAVAGMSLFILLSACGKSQDADTLIADARSFQQKGDSKAAIIQLKNSLQKSPGNGEARLLLGIVYEQTNDYQSAEIEFRKAAAAGISKQRVTPLLGKVLLETGQFQKALDETAPSGDLPESFDTLAVRGGAFLGLRKFDEAKAAFLQSLVKKPDNPDAMIGIARLAGASGVVSLAIRLTDEALAKNPGAIQVMLFRAELYRAIGKIDDEAKVYEQVIKIDPNNFPAHLSLANADIILRKFDAANVEIATARKLRPNHTAVQYAQAFLEFSQGKNGPALESLQPVLRSAPDYMPAVLIAGAAQLGTGQYEQAEKSLRKYNLAIPGNVYAQKLLASVLMKSGQFDQATKVLDSALKVTPNDPQLLMNAGEVFLQKKDFVKASEYFEKAKAIAPNAAVVHTALGMSNLGQGNSAKAVAELELATSLDDVSTRPGILLVMTQLRQKQFDKALESVKKLEKQRPADAQIQNLKGGVYLGKQDIPAARAAFEKALELMPTFIAPAENLARLDLQEKHPEIAKRRFEKILQTDNKNAEAMIALGKLEMTSGNTTAATGWFEKAVAENPLAIPPALQLGGFYLKTDAKSKALDLARKLYAANDGNPEVLDFLGQSQVANNDLRGALETFQKLAVVRPNSALAQTRIAGVQLAMRNSEEAISAMNKAVSLDPNNFETSIGLIQLKARAGDFDGATGIARQIQKQRPAESAGFVLEGDLLMAQKKPALALKAYDQGFALGKSAPLLIKQHQALIMAGNAKDADNRLSAWLTTNTNDLPVRLYFADSYLARKQFSAAVAQYQTVLKVTPQDAAVTNNLAYAYQQEKNPLALETAEKALKLAPENPVILDTLGWILVEKGNDARGLGLLQKASAKLPENNDVRLHLAIGLIKAGDKKSARTELEKLVAQKSYSGTEEAKRLLKDL